MSFKARRRAMTSETFLWLSRAAPSHQSDASCDVGSGGTNEPEFRAELGGSAAWVLWLRTGSRRAGCGALLGYFWGLQWPASERPLFAAVFLASAHDA